MTESRRGRAIKKNTGRGRVWLVAPPGPTSTESGARKLRSKSTLSPLALPGPTSLFTMHEEGWVWRGRIIAMGKKRKLVAQVGPVGTRLILMDFFCPHFAAKVGTDRKVGPRQNEKGHPHGCPLSSASCNSISPFVLACDSAIRGPLPCGDDTAPNSEISARRRPASDRS